jgi:hypothetical protein
MTVVVFCGPTVSAADVQEHVEAVCRPPAAHGDILRAVETIPGLRAIGLVDGFFRNVPAVRHKEILWALQAGVHVFGAASMGALRAAELADFGMVGVGTIFEDLKTGRIEDDDEVAVEHGPAELGYIPLSDAMVDIRATLDAAFAADLIGADTRRLLVERGKAMFYADRHWPDLIRQAGIAGADAQELTALDDWLPTRRVNRKRLDAVAMLTAIRQFMASDPAPFAPGFTFERTEAWERDRTAARALSSELDGSLLVEDVLDELRLRPHDHARIRREAFSRALALHEAKRRGLAPTVDVLENVLRDWLRERGSGMSKALRESRLGEMELDAFLREEALVRQVVDLSDEAIRATLLNTLRSRGWLHALAARAEAKKRALEEIGKDSVTTHTSGISPADLQAWFCRELAPGRLYSVSPEQLAARLGYDDPSAMSRALLREYYYRKYSTQKGITPPVPSLDDRNNFP